MQELVFNADRTNGVELEEGFSILFDDCPYEIETDEWNGFQIYYF